jgi:hypothetical protein
MRCLLLASLIPLVDTPSPEQVAFDYFTTVLVAQHYAQAKHLYVMGQSEAAATSKGPFMGYFPETRLRTFWAAYAATAATPVLITYRKFPVFKRASAFNS